MLEAVGFPLPVTIIGEMLGVPVTDRPQFRSMVRDLVAIFEMQPTDEQMAAADAAQLGIRAYFLDLIAEKLLHTGLRQAEAMYRAMGAPDHANRLLDEIGDSQQLHACTLGGRTQG